jgi:hypothetical protein
MEGEPKQTFVPTDSCCDSRLRKALRGGLRPDVCVWECPACGCQWFPRPVGGYILWDPHPIVEIHRRRLGHGGIS